MRRMNQIGLLVCVISLASCNRERRDLRQTPPARTIVQAAAESTLQPGGPLPRPNVSNPFQGNAYGISEGQRLFDWYNCSGCHAHGGGAIGPSLMDTDWVYGGEPAQVYDSIVRGRPNGMPTWGGRIPDYQVWQIVAYVRSLSGAQPQSATPARGDMIQRSSELPQKTERTR